MQSWILAEQGAAHQVKVLTDKYHIYLVSNGRVSMAGFNTKNVNYVADAIKYAVGCGSSR